jgi:hypothetical protein
VNGLNYCVPSLAKPARNIGVERRAPSPSLQFKKVDEPNVYSVRVGLGYRALGMMDGTDIVWFWIGSHSEYDKLI